MVLERILEAYSSVYCPGVTTGFEAAGTAFFSVFFLLVPGFIGMNNPVSLISGSK
jgi:hypothetical protein